MKQYEVKESGFSVLHNSGAWRLAAHVYDPDAIWIPRRPLCCFPETPGFLSEMRPAR